MNSIRAIRGMHDIFPAEAVVWQFLERRIAQLMDSYGYGEIRLPLLEQTELFRRSIGEVTDIVEKEMYTFDDRNGDSLTLRPEGTAGCVRAVLQEGLLNQVQRLWYRGPMFRHERPQKGRQRQFHQVGAELFGVATPDADAEMIAMTARLWRELGLSDVIELQLNSIGSAADRRSFREALVAYLRRHETELDEDSRRRLDSNPLRILDSKSPQTQAILNDAPALTEFLEPESVADFQRLRTLLDAAGISYSVNPRLVRGLDYYNKTVFEWVTTELGAQGTVCGGGRYDTLVEQLGGRPTPAVGFAMGLERLVLLLQQRPDQQRETPAVDVYAVAVGEGSDAVAMAAMEKLRSALPDSRLVMHLGGGSFRSQMKKADRSGARLALIWGEDEVAADSVAVKQMQGDGSQQVVPREQLEATVASLLA